jgi:hypothetical protein
MAYLRRAARLGALALQPSRAATGVDTIGGITYVAVRNSYKTLAVYRVLPSGRLRWLDEWPKQLDQDATKTSRTRGPGSVSPRNPKRRAQSSTSADRPSTGSDKAW